MPERFARCICVVTVLLCAHRLSADDLQPIHGQPSWSLSSDTVELFVTETGGHMAPVTFDRGTAHPVRPYYVSPWQEEGLALDVPVLVPLRGDFFCMPFGGNGAKYNGEQHPPHGEVAGNKWALVSKDSENGVNTLTLRIETRVRPGTVTKELSLVDGQNVVYSRHIVEGFAGPAPLGHHATLRLPDAEETVKVQSSPFVLGMTNPVLFSNPENREYQSLEIAAKFTLLSSVPTLWKDGGNVDCTLFPTRTGFADLVAVYKRPSAGNVPAWMTAINREEDYLWFSLKDPAMLPATVFWIENHGRHGVPWNGRNRCLGLEDLCSYFAEGLVPSVEANVVSAAGIPTAITLKADQPTEVRYIQGAVRVPAGFDEVSGIAFEPGKMVITSTGRQSLTVPVNHEFLRTGTLPGRMLR
jgi:hypothetical protein